MNALRRHLLLLLLPCLAGCLSLNFGPKSPTMAQELTALKKLRDRGTITAREFEMGKLALLNHHPGQAPTNPAYAETQVAIRPAVSEAPAESK